MKMICFLLVFAITYASTKPISPDYNYQTFMKQFDRNYVGQEKDLHEKIFNKNFKELLKRKQDGQDFQINTFMDWTQDQQKSFFNYKPQEIQVTPSQKPARLRSTYLGPSPSSLDYRTSGIVTAVKNQGGCGSCWAFAATALYESLIANATNGVQYDLAEQYALQCQNRSKGCISGAPHSAIILFNKTGVPLEETYHYNGNSTYYKSLGEPICTDADNIKLNKVLSSIVGQTDFTIQRLQQQLNYRGPVIVAIYSGHPGFKYIGKSGIVTCPPGPYKLDHVILLIGYNQTHWFIKNSWGTGWGDKGYGYIPKSIDCGIRQNVHSAVWVSSDSPNIIQTQTLTLQLTDSSFDGWQGNVLAIKQDNVYYSFGSNFTSGGVFGPFNITIKSNRQALIVVQKYGHYTSEMGFIINFSNGTNLITRQPGQRFDSNKIFMIFCPSENCIISYTIDYYLFMTDSQDDWNGNVLAFSQGDTIQTFGQQMVGVSSYGPIKMTFERFIEVNVIVSSLGDYSWEIGFQLRTISGQLIAARNPGSDFDETTVLSTFCPDCPPLLYASQQDQHFSQQENDKASADFYDNEKNNYMISTYVLAGIVGVIFIALIVMTILFVKAKSKLKDQDKVVVIGANERVDTMTNVTQLKSGGTSSALQIEHRDI